MGWEKVNGMPQIYLYKDGKYTEGSPSYWTWQTGHLWMTTGDICIKYTNDTKTRLQITSVGIKTVSCHSGGQGYWALGGYMSAPGCKGKGGTYTSFIQVSNDKGKSYSRCSIVDGKNAITVKDITSSNMNSAGSSANNTARFGDPPFSGEKSLSYKHFTISDCPVIEPGGHAFIHLRISTENSRDVVIRFVMDTDELDVVMEPVDDDWPYVYVWTGGKWVLKQPAWIYKNNKWTDPREVT